MNIIADRTIDVEDLPEIIKFLEWYGVLHHYKNNKLSIVGDTRDIVLTVRTI